MENIKKRILLHDRTGVPFTVQLGRELASRGHHVLYSYAAFFQSPKGSVGRKSEDPANFQIESMQLNKPFQKYSFIKRRFQEIEYAHDLVKQIKEYKPDTVILAGSHPDALTVVYRECKDLEAKFIFWVQDIYGLAIKRILNKKIPGLGSLIGNYYIWQEKQLLKKSDEIILITEDFIPLMNDWGIDAHKCHVIRNWTPIEELPVKPKNNPWARAHQLEGKFTFLYAGTLGLKHNPDLLLNLAKQFSNNDEIRIVVISEGLGADWLKKKMADEATNNLVLLDFQPFEQMPNVLGTADVLVAILEPDAGVYSAPSKVLTYLCAERALLLAIPPENLSAKLVAQNQAGLVVPPTDLNAFIQAAERFVSSPSFREQCALNGRLFAEKSFDIKIIGDHFEKII
jgi:glycosyltransferase involved in cell wall biosynthesis